MDWKSECGDGGERGEWKSKVPLSISLSLSLLPRDRWRELGSWVGATRSSMLMQATFAATKS